MALVGGGICASVCASGLLRTMVSNEFLEQYEPADLITTDNGTELDQTANTERDCVPPAAATDGGPGYYKSRSPYENCI